MSRNASLAFGALLLATTALLAQEIVFRSSAQVVNVTVSILDRNGRPVTDLRREELILLDDGRPREVQSFSPDEDLPLTLGLVADNSGSQREFIAHHHDRLQQFLRQVLQRDDRAFLVAIPGPSVLLQDVTGSAKKLQSALDKLDSPLKMSQFFRHQKYFGGGCPSPYVSSPTGRNCGSLIWNGVWASAGLRLYKIKGRKAILLLSDGEDTGSAHSLSDTIEAAQSADAPVYTIGSDYAMARGLRPGPGILELQRLSQETGGAYFDAPEDPTEVFSQIEAELRHLYVLSFAIPETDRDGKFHKLTVKSTREGVRVRSREGYVAK